MEFHIEKVFFKSDTLDPLTKLPVYVFDSNYLPDLSQRSDAGYKKTFDYIIVKAFKRIITRIPKHPYVLTLLTNGFKNFTNNNSQSWVTMLRCYQLLPPDLRSNLERVYIVHESWLVRSFTQILQNVLQIKFFKKNTSNGITYDRLVYCKDLTELSKHLNITKIRISLQVYEYDYQYTTKLVIPYSTKHDTQGYKAYLELILDRCVSKLLTEGKNYKLVFTRPGNQKKISILLDAIDRMNYLDLNQWDIHTIGSILLHILRNSETRLIPIDLIELPISDDYNYTLETFQKILNETGSFDLLSRIFEVLLSILDNHEVTEHTIKTISKSVAPALCQERVSLKTTDKLLIGQRFIRNLLEDWYLFSKDITKSVDGASKNDRPEAPPPRKIAFKKQQIISSRAQARSLPSPPHSRNVSGCSTISIDDDFDDHEVTLQLPSSKSTLRTDVDELKVLSDVTSSLNRLSKEEVLSPKKKASLAVKFSDGYSSIEGKKKVSTLAQLYEERLKGLQIIDEIGR